MNMPPPSDDTDLDALFAAARAAQSDTSRAEYGFETRLLARLAAERAGSPGWREFTVWCWRLLPGLAVVTLAFGWWTGQPGAEDQSFAVVQSLAAGDDDFSQWFAVNLPAPI